MSNFTPIPSSPQRPSARAHVASTPLYVATAAGASSVTSPVSAHPFAVATATIVEGIAVNDMAWLGGVDENGCISDTGNTKRTITGRLAGVST